MRKKLNKEIRILAAVLGAIFALCKLIERIEIPHEPEEEGFALHEFDDIW